MLETCLVHERDAFEFLLFFVGFRISYSYFIDALRLWPKHVVSTLESFKIMQLRHTDCNEDYLEAFSEKFYKDCLVNCKPAFVQIPVASCFLIVGIVAALHWAPFHHKTLKKPGFVSAFFISLILVAINVGQIFSIIIPMVNHNALPDKQGFRTT